MLKTRIEDRPFPVNTYNSCKYMTVPGTCSIYLIDSFFYELGKPRQLSQTISLRPSRYDTKPNPILGLQKTNAVGAAGAVPKDSGSRTTDPGYRTYFSNKKKIFFAQRLNEISESRDATRPLLQYSKLARSVKIL